MFSSNYAVCDSETLQFIKDHETSGLLSSF